MGREATLAMSEIAQRLHVWVVGKAGTTGSVRATEPQQRSQVREKLSFGAFPGGRGPSPQTLSNQSFRAYPSAVPSRPVPFPIARPRRPHQPTPVVLSLASSSAREHGAASLIPFALFRSLPTSGPGASPNSSIISAPVMGKTGIASVSRAFQQFSFCPALRLGLWFCGK